MYFLLKEERKSLCEITVKLTIQNLTVVFSASFFEIEYSTTGIGHPINNILKNNL